MRFNRGAEVEEAEEVHKELRTMLTPEELQALLPAEEEKAEQGYADHVGRQLAQEVAQLHKEIARLEQTVDRLTDRLEKLERAGCPGVQASDLASITGEPSPPQNQVEPFMREDALLLPSRTETHGRKRTKPYEDTGIGRWFSL